jgi:uncharacterized membrane protein YccF (DUF307 family)
MIIIGYYLVKDHLRSAVAGRVAIFGIGRYWSGRHSFEN